MIRISYEGWNCLNDGKKFGDRSLICPKLFPLETHSIKSLFEKCVSKGNNSGQISDLSPNFFSRLLRSRSLLFGPGSRQRVSQAVIPFVTGVLKNRANGLLHEQL